MGHAKCVFDPFGVNGVDTNLISTAMGQTSPVSFKTGWSNPQYQRASNSVGYFLPKLGGFFGLPCGSGGH